MIGFNTELVGCKVSVNTKLVSGEVEGNIEVGGDIEIGKDLLKLILNKLSIALVIIFGTCFPKCVPIFATVAAIPRAACFLPCHASTQERPALKSLVQQVN